MFFRVLFLSWFFFPLTDPFSNLCGLLTHLRWVYSGWDPGASVNLICNLLIWWHRVLWFVDATCCWLFLSRSFPFSQSVSIQPANSNNLVNSSAWKSYSCLQLKVTTAEFLMAFPCQFLPSVSKWHQHQSPEFKGTFWICMVCVCVCWICVLVHACECEGMWAYVHTDGHDVWHLPLSRWLYWREIGFLFNTNLSFLALALCSAHPVVGLQVCQAMLSFSVGARD